MAYSDRREANPEYDQLCEQWMNHNIPFMEAQGYLFHKKVLTYYGISIWFRRVKPDGQIEHAALRLRNQRRINNYGR